MKLVVFGASGAVGSRVVQEALDRGHAVTAVARDSLRLAGLPTAARRRPLDVLDTDAVALLLARHDGAVSALRPPAGREPALVDLNHALLWAGARSGVHLVVVGGAATLKLADASGHTVLSAPGFLPDAVRPIALACATQRQLVLDHPQVAWSHLCPPAMLVPGERTGRYRTGSDTLVVDADGQARISLEDFAVALVDECELRTHAGRSYTVGW